MFGRQPFMSYLDFITCRSFVKSAPAVPGRVMSTFTKRYYKIPRAEIGYLRFILESYDGLAFVRTLDNREALVEIAFPASRRQDAEELLAALAVECSMVAVPTPEPGAYPSL